MSARYYTSEKQLAMCHARGRHTEWLQCHECDGDGFYPDPDEPDESELCGVCLGRGGEWGVRVATVVLSVSA
jgi:hypothetical protein